VGEEGVGGTFDRRQSAGRCLALFSLESFQGDKIVPATVAFVVTAITAAFIIFAVALAFADQWSKKK